MKKKKKRKFDLVKEVKRLSRESIGQIPKGRVVPDKKKKYNRQKAKSVPKDW